MSAFSESFQKELGTGLAKWTLRGIAALLAAGLLLYQSNREISLVVLAIATILLVSSASYVVFRWLTYRKRELADAREKPRHFQDDYTFDTRLAIYRHKTKPEFFCASCTPNGIESPLKVMEHGWQCQIKGCEKFHPNPDYKAPPRPSPYSQNDTRHPDFFG